MGMDWAAPNDRDDPRNDLPPREELDDDYEDYEEDEDEKTPTNR